MTKRRLALPLVLVLVLVVAACGDDTEPVDAGAPSGEGDDGLAGALDGREFLAKAAAGHEIVPGTEISLRFEDGSVSAHAGCNSMSGPYAIDGDVLLVDGLATTEIGCDPDRHDQDQFVADLLTAAPTVDLDGDSLRVATTSARLEMVDRSVADPDPPIEATTWALDGLVEGDAVSSVPEGARATITFDRATSTIRLQGPCNDGGVPYDTGTAPDVEQGEVQIGAAEVEQEGCEGPAGEVEAHLLEVFAGPLVVVAVESGTLTITAADGERGASFRAADPATGG